VCNDRYLRIAVVHCGVFARLKSHTTDGHYVLAGYSGRVREPGAAWSSQRLHEASLGSPPSAPGDRVAALSCSDEGKGVGKRRSAWTAAFKALRRRHRSREDSAIPAEAPRLRSTRLFSAVHGLQRVKRDRLFLAGHRQRTEQAIRHTMEMGRFALAAQPAEYARRVADQRDASNARGGSCASIFMLARLLTPTTTNRPTTTLSRSPTHDAPGPD
jgi:hypothetical protein